MKAKDLTGEQFGQLTVVRLHEDSAAGARKWVCECSCGRDSAVIATTSALNAGDGRRRCRACFAEAHLARVHAIARESFGKRRRTCKICKKVFAPSWTQISSGVGFTCSKKCAGVLHSSVGSVEHKCRCCGRLFRVLKSAVDAAIFCSQTCVKRYRKSKIIKRTCDECGRSMSSTPSREAVGCGRYCSMKCSGRGRSMVVNVFGRRMTATEVSRVFGIHRNAARRAIAMTKGDPREFFRKLSAAQIRAATRQSIRRDAP